MYLFYVFFTTLYAELLVILNDSDAPLRKKLKIADKAYNSNEFPLQRKESLLIKWLLQHTEDVDSWQLLLNWLKSEIFKNLNRNELHGDDINEIIEV